MEPAVNYDHSTYRRRLVRIAIGVVAAVGGVLLIAIGQLALTPIARADDFTGIIVAGAECPDFLISPGNSARSPRHAA